VTLTPTPAAGSEFKGWSGACSGTGTCKVTMSAAKTVGAEFALEKHLLTVTKGGTGSGSVSSNPAGINCGSTCSASFDHNLEVTLTATPVAGSEFKGWSGACSGSGTCKVTMNAAKTVTAEFVLEQRLLTVNKSGAGGGTVSSSPTGIDCGPTCEAPFNLGTEVTLTPSAASGSEFKGWSGACTGSGACKVTMNAAKAVTAEFVLIPGPATRPGSTAARPAKQASPKARTSPFRRSPAPTPKPWFGAAAPKSSAPTNAKSR
jgi:hypothetical protein